MSTEWIDWEPPVCPGCARLMSEWKHTAVVNIQVIKFHCGASLKEEGIGSGWVEVQKCIFAHSEEAMDAGQAKDQAAIAAYYQRQQDAKNQGGS